MIYHIDIQHATTAPPPIDDETITRWANMALATQQKPAELTIRLVDLAEITHLNATYRKQNKATNVLSFPSNLPENIKVDYPLLGDVIICPDVLQNESMTLNKSIEAHWALILIHGILHLLGYDHVNEADAAVMQNLETKLLDQLGFGNPYFEDQEIE